MDKAQVLVGKDHSGFWRNKTVFVEEQGIESIALGVSSLKYPNIWSKSERIFASELLW